MSEETPVTPEPANSEPTADPAGADPTPNGGATKTFTQAEVDNILKDRLARQKAAVEGAAQKAKDEAERLAAEKQGEFEKLYKDTLTKLEQAELRARTSELARIRTTIGAKLQLPTELQDRLRGETEEEIEADAKILLAAIPKPTPITNTDGAQGVNGSVPTQQYTDAEIRDMAAQYGVKFEHLKASLIK